jgi:hypothetical protein
LDSNPNPNPNPKDMLVQKDITFIMNRSVKLWRTWYTEPMPNIGMHQWISSDVSINVRLRSRVRVRVCEFRTSGRLGFGGWLGTWYTEPMPNIGTHQ